jgi:hypothetical protein
MSTVNQLRSVITKSQGMAKGNRYRVLFSAARSEYLNILCDSVNIPGRQIITQDFFTDMKGIKTPYGFVNEEVSISFLLGNDWYAWDYLKAWQNSTINQIDSLRGAYTVNFRDQYTRQVVIEHLDERNNIRKTVTLINAFPTSLTSMELSNASENTVLRCTAVFSYDNWQDGKVTTPELTGEFNVPGIFVSDTLV